MAGAIFPHAADVNLTNYIFLARRSRNQKDKNRFSYVILPIRAELRKGASIIGRSAKGHAGCHPYL
jgi:hypothetical protein